ncbi:MAG: hypothetical protein GY749_40340 [Desulfobacteraceae bacterium]|nr:hypothetical protein [Desulfobacteraceae bacterium]
MPKEHSHKTRYKAEELYVEFGLSLEDISRSLDISYATLLNWQGRFNWYLQRQELLKTEEAIGLHEKRAEQKLAERIADNPNHLNILTWQIYQKAKSLRQKKTEGISRKSTVQKKMDCRDREFELPDTEEGLDEIVTRMVYQKIIADLANDETDVLTIMSKMPRFQYSNIAREKFKNELKKAADTVESIIQKEKNVQKGGGLKKETVQEIKKTILGVSA